MEAPTPGRRGSPIPNVVWLLYNQIVELKGEADIMLRRALHFSICVLISWGVLQRSPVSAQQGQNPAGGVAQSGSTDARRVALYDGMVSFVPPEGFSLLSEEIVAAKFPDRRGPGIVYGNTRATVSVAITYPEQRVLRPEQLPDFKAFMEAFLEKQKPGMEWLRKEIVEIGAQRWIHFEFISPAVDTKIHNHMYLTSMDERMLMFNFNATVEQYAGHKDALEKSKDSIRIEAKK